MNIALPILKGLQAAYENIAAKDPNIIYITTDEGNIYLGEVMLGGTDCGKTVRSIAFDEETRIFSVEYTDGEEYEIDFALQSVIQDVNYDPSSNVLTFTLTSGATTDISLAALMNIYTGGETGTASADVDDGEILVDVKVSGKAGNTLSAEPDGLYVAAVELPAVADAIVDSTDNGAIPNVGAVKLALEIGSF